MKLLFELTMPNVGSWNGIWTGDKDVHLRARKVDKKKAIEILDERDSANFHYSWSDGWSANVRVSLYVAKFHGKQLKKTAGFSGYDWMIDSILKCGKILNSNGK